MGRHPDPVPPRAPLTTPARLPVRVELGLVLVTAVAGVGLGRLTTAPGSWRVVVPVTCAVVAGHGAVAGLGRRALRWRSLAAGLAVVVLVCAWWFASGTTLWGLPTAATARHLWHLLAAAGHLITSGPTPVRATSGVVMCVVAGAGATSVLARWLSGPRRAGGVSVAGALVPPVGLFCYTALLSSGVGRLWGALGFLGALMLFVYLADSAGARRRVVAAGLHQVGGPAFAGWSVARVTGTLLVVTVSLAVPLAAGPALAGMQLDALPFGRPGPGHPGGAGAGRAGATADIGSPAASATAPGELGAPATVPALSLVDDIGSVLASDQSEVVFTADTPVPTYWQVATLTRFDGRRFTADPVTAAAARVGQDGGAGALPGLSVPAPGPLFEAAVSIVGLRTYLLPVPPGTVAVSGEEPIDLRGNVGATVPWPVGPGYTYVAAAGVPTAPPAPGLAGPAPSASDLAPYLALPRVDRTVAALARALVHGVSGSEARAQAIAGWFRSGRFHYSLTATAGQSLDTFLFGTRTGFCQQFAAAFAVLARLDGLPTRLAVGFTAGRRGGAGPYVVTGADAHIWPEVYLGPSVGWTSLEPTPASGDGTPAVGVLQGVVPSAGRSALLGTLGAIRKAGSSSPPSASTAPAPATPQHRVAGAGHATRAGHVHGSVGALAWAVVGLGAAALVWLTRRRWLAQLLEIPSRLRAPRAAVMGSWRRAARELDHRHLGRAPQETLAEHATRLLSSRPRVGEPYEALAALAARACYAADAPSAAEVRAARRLRADVCSQARRRPRRPAAGVGSPRTGRQPS